MYCNKTYLKINKFANKMNSLLKKCNKLGLKMTEQRKIIVKCAFGIKRSS